MLAKLVAPRWGNKLVTAITKTDVAKLLAKIGEAPAGNWGLWLNAINRMPEDGFTLPDLATLLYRPGWGGG